MKASAQLRYAITFLVVTFIALAFLNVYSSQVNEQLFRRSKQSALLEKANLISNEVAATGQVTRFNAYTVVLRSGVKSSQIVITDEELRILYDSSTPAGPHHVLPAEIALSFTREPVFTWDYRNSVMTATVAVPIYINAELAGYVYLVEMDRSDGLLLKSLHLNILTISMVLISILILFSVFYVRRYSHRLKKITTSMRIIQEGDYSHKIEMRGNDELGLLANEFNYLTERLQISESKRRQFVSDASHELKTPLASIKLLSDSILQYDMDMETVREFAEDISNEADRLNRMTMKLLALTKDEGNTAAEDAEIIYMSPTVERVIKMLSGIAAANRITITTDLANDSPVLIQEDDLYQITYNLVENGIKYNVKGGSLNISLHRQDEMAILRVSDTGTGIPPESIGHVFERFYRVDKARARQSGGSGLGLAIVRAMVERNNGEINLQSTVGKGTTFAVAFPCFDTEDMPEEEYNDIDNEGLK
jgi:signal transduction histidine kinase